MIKFTFKIKVHQVTFFCVCKWISLPCAMTFVSYVLRHIAQVARFNKTYRSRLSVNNNCKFTIGFFLFLRVQALYIRLMKSAIFAAAFHLVSSVRFSLFWENERRKSWKLLIYSFTLSNGKIHGIQCPKILCLQSFSIQIHISHTYKLVNQR